MEAQNLEFHRGSDGGWKLICEPNDDRQEVEPFDIPLANELIGSTHQAAGVQVISLSGSVDSAEDLSD